MTFRNGLDLLLRLDDQAAADRVGVLGHLPNIAVLHWHGEAFDLPTGTERLTSPLACETQAFASGRNILGLRFHRNAGTLPHLQEVDR